MLLWLIACRSEAECADGFTGGDDGLCYEVVTAGGDDTGGEDTDTPDAEPPTPEDVLDALPPCEPVSGDGRLDLDLGCADGACPGMSYVEMVDVLGEPASRQVYYYDFDGYSFGSVDCSWANGVSANFADDDRDGEPDAIDTAYGIYLYDTFDGTTADGLGLGADVACFVASLGMPDEVGFTAVEKDWFVSSAYWADWGLSLSDYTDPRGSYAPDGRADSLALYGASGEL